MNGSQSASTATRAERRAEADKPNYPENYGAIKRSIVPPEDEAAIVKAWSEVLQALDSFTSEIESRGSEIIPQFEFSELEKLADEQKDEIRRAGSMIMRNVVDDEEALKWKEDLKAYVKANPQVKGYPEDNKQFFEVYWSAPQVAARSHPNVIAAQAFLNGLWTKPSSADAVASMSTPVAWADRFRIRQPGRFKWDKHPPHIDGPSIGRWADPYMRECFAEIFKGKWREHDPYRSETRIIAKANNPETTSQGTVFIAWQGWLAMSNTGPGEGTLRVFPKPQLSNAYIILRPFFRLVSPDADPFRADNWVFDASTAHFPGIYPGMGVRITEDTHPNLRTDTCMVSVPRVRPGDMVFWHNDVPHAVEEDHNGQNDSSVIYIGALPLTLQNASYLVPQREAFRSGDVPPDHKNSSPDGEMQFAGKGTAKDILSVEGRRAMGLESFAPTPAMSAAERELLVQVNRLISV